MQHACAEKRHDEHRAGQQAGGLDSKPLPCPPCQRHAHHSPSMLSMRTRGYVTHCLTLQPAALRPVSRQPAAVAGGRPG